MKISIQLTDIANGFECLGDPNPSGVNAEFSLVHHDAEAVLSQAERFLCSAITNENGEVSEMPSARALVVQSSSNLRSQHAEEMKRLKGANDEELESTRALARMSERDKEIAADEASTSIAAALERERVAIHERKAAEVELGEAKTNVERLKALVDTVKGELRDANFTLEQNRTTIESNETARRVDVSQLIKYQEHHNTGLMLVDDIVATVRGSKTFDFDGQLASRIAAYLAPLSVSEKKKEPGE